MITQNNYNLYINNILTLLSTSEFEYSWFDLNEIEIYNGIKNSKTEDFEFYAKIDPYINKYKNNPLMLGKDILQRGTFTPFFYIEKNQKIYLLMGKHRIFSLILCKTLGLINRKFLFIKLPTDKLIYNYKLVYFHKNYSKQLYSSLVSTPEQLIHFLFDTGDALTPYLWENNCTPFPPFNDEKLFEEWLNTPIEKIKINGNIYN